MKNWKVWISIFGALAILVGVLFTTPILGPSESSAAAMANGTFKLYAGQTTDAGDGTVCVDDGDLYFTITPNCPIQCIHVAIYDTVGDMPSGNPAPGQFPYSFDCADYDGGVHSFMIGDYDLTGKSSIIIAIHTVTKGCTGVYQEDTAWACANTDPGACSNWPGASQWAYYFEYTPESCGSG
jgi:hypothetical protein